MTGFARVTGDADWGSWAWEAKSVNGRGMDVRMNTPNGFDGIENEIKTRLGKTFKRGSFQLALRVECDTGAGSVAINAPLLETLSKQVVETTGAPLTPEAAATLLSMKGVVETDSQSLRDLAGKPEIAAAVVQSGAEVIEALTDARQAEGRWLKETLTGLIDDMRRHATTARDLASDQPQRLKSRLERQIQDLGAEELVEKDRMAAELALSAAKADVREELDRLEAHLAEALKLLAGGSPVGRKLDFLAQELNREANTLCSKSISLDLTNEGLALKALIDQFKEQAANVE